MKVKGSINYRKALAISPDRLIELEIILLEYCTKVEYSVVTIKGMEILFSDKTELFEYDNFGNRRIQELSIRCYNDITSASIIDIDFISESDCFALWGYNTTCRCRYRLEDIKQADLFTSAVSNFLKKITTKYWLIGKFSLAGLLAILGLLSALHLWINPASQKTQVNIFILIIAFALYALVCGINQFLRKLFPPIAFLFGEETERQQENTELRKNLFWVVIIGLAIAIIASWLYNQVF